MEVPTKADFLKVDGARLIHPPNAMFSVLSYKKMSVNMRAVIDYSEFDEEIVIFDEDKNEEYTKAIEEWRANNGGGGVHQMANGNGMVITQPTPPPKAPTKKIRLLGTTVVYQNNTERIIMMDMETWEEKYFAYLQAVKLDFLGVKGDGEDGQ